MTHEECRAAILAREAVRAAAHPSTEHELRQQLADVSNERDGLRASLKTMVVYYKNAVSTGYDRITQLGGDCDSVARMLADNPDYAHAVGLLAQSAPATDESKCSDGGQCSIGGQCNACPHIAPATDEQMGNCAACGHDRIVCTCRVKL